ncbi:translation initiation factor IF-2 [Ruoffia tabacinasalis]|uniref:translation initiation factor IF-2 n=1 Tax=Ruoffia tabacinasalis TaxID=87458 RepID=UPI003F98787D
MTKRVYEYAKEHDLTSKELLTMAKSKGMEFGSHMSSISEDQEKQLNNIISNKNTKKSEKPETNSKEANKEGSKPSQNTNKKASDKNQAKQNQHKKEETKTNTKQNNNSNKNASNNNKSSNQPGRRNRRNRRGKGNKNFKNTESKGITQRKHKDLPEKLVYSEGTNIQEIAKMLHRDTSEIIKKLMMNGVMANQNQALSKDVIELIALEYGVEPEEKVVVDVSDLDVYFEEEQDEAKLTIRPAVVTIMGHVDHGKTTLLDQLRHSRVTEGEAGGITQHIGAYQVETEDDNIITFLDTPGHEAFTTMRARGADVTDIAIIVVAADDGVMPQTVEAINHAKAADVPIIIAVNKIDKPTANPDRVKQELSEHGIISEDWGGDNIFVEISAKFNQNIEELLEMIVLVAEVQELKANPDRLALGSVIEARLDKNQGATATLLVQDGTLNVGDPIVVGNTYGRVRTMVNDIGRRIRTAGPATPVEITGLQTAPQAGDLFVVFEDEKTARQAGEQRAQEAQEAQRSLTKKVTLDNLFESLQEGELKSVNVIIKADVQGSAEALSASLQKIEVEGVRVNVVHQAVGAINESDISLAAASGAIVIGFNVRPTPQARLQADSEVVDIRQYRVIYDAIEEIETAMKGMLDPEYEEEVQGQALVRETFTVSKLGTIAGSFVTDGYIARDSQVRLIRDNIVIFEGEIASLKRFQDDAKQVAKGYECGIMIENYNDVKMDDVIEAFHMVEIER